jgi:hypothetical protein
MHVYIHTYKQDIEEFCAVDFAAMCQSTIAEPEGIYFYTFYAFMYVFMCTYVYIHICIYSYMYMFIYVRTCVWLYA